jgi:hypothetical protein
MTFFENSLLFLNDFPSFFANFAKTNADNSSWEEVFYVQLIPKELTSILNHFRFQIISWDYVILKDYYF